MSEGRRVITRSQSRDLLRDAAIAVWLNWLVVVHKPRRLQKRHEQNKQAARLNVMLACGNDHSLLIQKNGSIACTGCNADEEAPPEGVPGDFVAVSAGECFSMALRRDGSIAWWGDNGLWRWDDMRYLQSYLGYDQGSDFVAIAAGHRHALAIRSGGSIVCWGFGEEQEVYLCVSDGDVYTRSSERFRTDLHIV